MPWAGFGTHDANAFRLAASAAADYRHALDSAPIRPARDYAGMLAEFAEPLPETGLDADEVVEILDSKGRDGLANSCSPRFFGYVIGGGLPAAVAADWMVAAWNQNSPMIAFTPTAGALEEVLRQWLVELLDLPRNAAMGVTTGATMANTAGLAAARNAMLARSGWDVEAAGLFGAPEVPILAGAELHSSVQASLRLLGFGAERIVRIEADDQGRMRPDRLRDAVAHLDSPPIIVAQAGQINSGAIDPMAEIADIAQASEAWLHVDGAFGLWAHAHPELRPQILGVDRASSWAVDGHKWLQVPYDCGFVFVRDVAAHVRAMSTMAAYLPNSGTMKDPGDFVPELSRRARGVPAWAAIKALGRQGVLDLIARNCRLARRMADALAAELGIQILNEVNLNQVIVAFGEPGERGDALTDQVLKAVQAEGTCYPTHGNWHGRRIMRLSVCGFATTDEDADRTVAAIRDTWRRLEQSPEGGDVAQGTRPGTPTGSPTGP